MSVFNASVLLFTMNFVTTLSKVVFDKVMTKFMINKARAGRGGGALARGYQRKGIPQYLSIVQLERDLACDGFDLIGYLAVMVMVNFLVSK